MPEERRVVITAHDAFNYFGRAYGFEVRGLQGISTASEAGTSDIKQLADLIAQRRIPAVFVESSVSRRAIEAVREAVRSRGWDVEIGEKALLRRDGRPRHAGRDVRRHGASQHRRLGRGPDGRGRLVSTAGVPALQVEDLTVAYGERPALWDVDLEVPVGTLMAIVGPNGAGKTTLIRAVLGLLEPAAGSVRVFGQPYDRQRGLVAYVPQRGSVDWDFPADVLDVVTMGRYGALGWLRRPGRREREAALAALDQVG